MAGKHELSDSQMPQSDEVLSEVLQGLPKEKREIIERTFVSQIAMINRTSPEGEIAKKISEGHIDKLLDNRAKAMEYTHKDEVQKKVFFSVMVVLVLITVFGVILLLKDNPDTMERILTVIVTAIISGLGGYGVGKGRGSNDS